MVAVLNQLRWLLIVVRLVSTESIVGVCLLLLVAINCGFSMIHDSRCEFATHNLGKPKSYAYCRFLPIIDDANVYLCAFQVP